MVDANLRGIPASYDRCVSTSLRIANLGIGASSYLQLGEGETTTGADAAVVLDSRAAHDWPQLVDRARSELGSLFNARGASALLAARL